MTRKKKLFLVVFAFVIFSLLGLLFIRENMSSSSANPENKIITASILPVKFIIDKLSNNTLEVNVLVPPGVSPETYEPTPQQMVKFSKSKAIFTIGLIDFEASLTGKLAGRQTEIYQLYKGIELIEGSCSHNHEEKHGFHGGIDPHIWMSLRCLKVIASNALDALTLLYPSDADIFKHNYSALIAEIDSLDIKIKKLLSVNNVKCFLIYHPVLSYYSVDYGVEQMTVEHEGKEPSVNQLKMLVDNAKAKNVKTLLYQKEFDSTVAEAIAKDIGAELREIEPLSENVLESIYSISRIIASEN